ncbi:MAG: GNAT family N-acetyltransferase [Eubacterium sp.]|nr:GNAT family N-acetyltransferase [Eubacterium sp.]
MKLQLRRFLQPDAALLYQITRDSIQLGDTENKIYVNSDREFFGRLAADLQHFYHDFFVIESADSDMPTVLGYVYSYDYRPNDRHCQLAVRMNGTTLVTEAVNAFTAYLFREYPLIKVFVQVTDPTLLPCLTAAGFAAELTLKDYCYENGRAVDMTVLSRYAKETL